ncbi:hypothetical protein GCM10025871_06680 [Deinococcus metallilatus]|nr:hypothetical protein GCM10025871_06680 [Deinococcus metallilatus]
MHRRKLAPSLTAVLSLLILFGCARQETAGRTPTAPPTTQPQPSLVKVALRVQDATLSRGTYLTVPIELQAQGGSINAAELQLDFDASRVKLVGVLPDETALVHLNQTDDLTPSVTVLRSQPGTTQVVRAVFQLLTDQPARIGVQLSQAVDGQNQLVSVTAQTALTLNAGEGGTATAPDTVSLERQVQDALQARGLLDPQTLNTPSLLVPTTLDPTWAAFEAGDLDQSGSVNLADSALLSRFLLAQQVPTSYQAYAADLIDVPTKGVQTVDAADLGALLVKTVLIAAKRTASLPTVHPLAVNANATQSGLILAGNALNGPQPISVSADQPWLKVQRQSGSNGASTAAFTVTADAPQGSTGTITLTFPNNIKRTVQVKALAPAPNPNQIVGTYTAELQSGFQGLTFTKNGTSVLELTAANPSWNAASHVFSSDVTIKNTGTTPLPGVKAILREPRPDSLRAVNPSGYASDDAPFIEYGALAPGQSQTLPWRVYSPADQTGTLRVDLTSVAGKLGLTTAAPASFSRDAETIVTVQGSDIRAETAFFIESTKLQVRSWKENSAELVVPAGFPPSTYGIMAVNPNGERAVLYPAFTVTPGRPPVPQDPKAHARSFVDGFVLDITTKKPIAGAVVGLPGLTTKTASNGYFLLRGVPQGRQTIEINAPGYERIFRFAEVKGEQQTVTVKLAELQPKHEAVTMIGPEGGVHYANDGSFLKVPAGALDQNVPIEFTQLTGANALPELPQDGYFLAFARLGPVGLTFKKPATLFLPLQPGISIPDGTPIRISYFDEREGRWVQDITSGVITTVDGRQFLEYEINHFTWIGGQFFPDPVEGCVVDQSGNPLAGVVTNWGVTDEAGKFHGTTTQSQSGRDLYAYAADPQYVSGSVRQYYGGPGTVKFPCLTVQVREPWLYPPTVLRDNSDCSVATMRSSANPTSLVAARTPSTTLNASTSGNSFLVTTTKTFKGISASVDDVAGQGIDPSTVLLTSNGKDLVKDVEIKLDEHGELTMVVTPELLDGSSTQSVTFSARNKYGKSSSVIQNIKIVDHLEVEEPTIVLLPDSDIPSEIQTPYQIDGSGGRVILARESDAFLQNGSPVISAKVKVKAVDKSGVLVGLNNNYAMFKDLNSHGPFVNGEAEVNVNLPTNASADLSHVTISEYGYSDSSGAMSVKPNVIGISCGVELLAFSKSGQAAKSNIFDRFYANKYGKLITDWIAGIASKEACAGSFCFTVEDAVTVGWSLLPWVGDVSTLAQEATNKLLGKGMDPVASVLAGLSLAADFSEVGLGLGTVGSGLIGVYKISKLSGKGFIADLIKDAINRGPGLKDPIRALQLLKDELSFIVDIGIKGGTNKIRELDSIFGGLNGLGMTLKDAGSLIRSSNDSLTRYGFDNLDFLSKLEGISHVPGVDEVMRRIASAQQASNVTGALKEINVASALEGKGLGVLEMGKDVPIVYKGAARTADVDIITGRPLTYWDTKSSLNKAMTPGTKTTNDFIDQVERFSLAAASNGAKAVYYVDDASKLSAPVASYLRSKGIDVVDASGTLLNP